MEKVRICYKKFIKKAFFILLVFMMLFPANISCAGELTEQAFITVKINGTPIYTDTNPYVKEDRIFVPVRFIAEALNMNVEWIPDEKKITLSDDEDTIQMWLDSNLLIVNDEEILMDVNVEGFNGRIMVPVRYLAEIKGFEVKWDDYTYSVELNKEGVEVPASSVLNRSYTDDDIIWLARIIHVEARYLSIDAKVAIANVVLNRTKHPDFPDTVYDVIFDSKYGKQFPPAHTAAFRQLKPDESCVIAAKMALEGINNVDKCLYFNNQPFKNKSKDFYIKIDGEYFYY
ncbi:copper amine oxidase domain protein [Thermoclostridium stercorarium subsp. stercorarium DSM 8532]|uniref:Copper amine oxidase domain protein n=2 Tax=Thermoclostridium stercorarium TaxID=1510 RepID=L7VL58_THES1|nr:stalk domain-containing protein [Thermoclostridium stercorarium]AGC67201.1 copper amine oxidase domain protein [Thermoclostridium stercorarium subsp. stercorarium DSM 8532]AGI38279.1 copper amine oxidase [Thermoclostridium stercorarium subsp. stercorarium DSM 8532]ANW97671.1 copper amine oxidase [Thermoclostridium stercorarium subsp. thermolacticum DSM 2910]